jgi:hypothetical protein
MQPLSVGRVAVVGVGVFVPIEGYPGAYNRYPLPLVNDGTICHHVDWKAMIQATIYYRHLGCTDCNVEG